MRAERIMKGPWVREYERGTHESLESPMCVQKFPCQCQYGNGTALTALTI